MLGLELEPRGVRAKHRRDGPAVAAQAQSIGDLGPAATHRQGVDQVAIGPPSLAREMTEPEAELDCSRPRRTQGSG
jgi:hypothetical protein